MAFVPNTILTAEDLNAAFAEKADAAATATALAAKADLVGGKVPTSQLPDAILGALSYQDTWNATSNTPAITGAAPSNKGHYYIVAVAGTTSVGGETDWQVGDWVVSNGTTWNKVDNSDKVSSVNGKAGAVELVASDVGAVPTTRTVNGKPLSGDVTLTPADVGAQASMTAASQAEMEAGTEAGVRSMSPARVKQAIKANTGAVSFTTSSAVTAGGPVSLKTDGTVRACGVEPSVSGTPINLTTSGSNQPLVSYDSVNGKYVYFYVASNTLYGVVGTVSGTTISLGTPVSLATSAVQAMCVSYDTVQNVFLVGWYGTDSYMRATCCAVSGTSLTVGGSVTYASRASNNNQLTYCPGKGCHIGFTTDDSVNPSKGYVFTLWTTGNSAPGISALNQLSLDYAQGGRMAYNPNEGFARAIVRWAQVGQTSYYYKFNISGSGSGSSASAVTEGSPGDYRWTDAGCVYDPVSGATLQFFYNGSTGAFQCVAVNSSGTRGAVTGMPSGYTPLLVQPNAVVTVQGQSFVLMRNASNFVFLVPFTITGTSVSFGTPASVLSEAVNYALMCSGSSQQTSFVYITAAATTTNVANLHVPPLTNIAQFIGIAKSTVASGQPIDVNTIGSVNSQVSGLSAGSIYYLDNTGALTTTATTGIKAGRALSATSILVTGG